MVNWRSEVNTPLRLKGLHDQIGVDAVDRVEIDDAVRVSVDRAEAHALAHEIARARPGPSRGPA